MSPKYLTLVMAVGACGEVAREPVDGGTSLTYKGTLDQTAPKMFGGSPYCSYTITFKQLDVEIGILPSTKQVLSGQVQNLNVEAVVPTTPACPNAPTGPTISKYTFAPATPSMTGMALTFQGAMGNAPVATLTVNVSPAAAGYTAALSFHRTDVPVPLDWSVTAAVVLKAP